VTRSAADTTRGTLYDADSDPVLGTPRLVAIDATTGAELASAPLPYAPEQILPLPARGVVLTFQWNGLASVEEVAGWDSTTLARVFDFAAYGIESFFGAADVGDGRVVLAGLEPAGFEFTLALLDVGASLPTAPSPAAALASPPSITIASSGLAPLAVGRASGANPLVGIVADAHLAAVALDDGNVAVADLDAPTPAFVLTVETWSPAAIESIAAAAADGPLGPRTGVAVATKPGDDLSIGFDLASGSLLWSVPGNAPGVASVDGPLAFVANSGDNDVSVVNLATGARVARVNLDVRPGAPGFAGAAAFVPSGGVDGDVLFPSTAFPGLMRFPTGTGEPVSVSRTPDNAFLSAALETRSAWSAAGGSSPFVEGWLDGSWDAPVLVGLPAGATPRITAASGHLLAVGHDAGLSLIDGAAPPVTADVAAVPGAAAPVFLALGFTPTGDVWTLVERDADVQAQLWAPTAILAGGLPTATWTVPGTPLGAALLEDGLWVFHLDAGFAPVATLLEEESLLKIGTVTPSDRLTGVHAVSPNGRLLVLRELGGALGFVLRFFRADPDAGFPEVGSLVFTERIEGFTFDATGERLFVLTQAPDRVVTVD
jgi:YVTN family beta-propeller protein